MSNAITKEQIDRFVAAWYRALDQHDPIQVCYDMLADEGLRVIFPDGDITASVSTSWRVALVRVPLVWSSPARAGRRSCATSLWAGAD